MKDHGLQAHIAYVERWKASGKRTQILVTPCCSADLEVPSQDRNDGQQWDSLMTCPHCGALFMKIVTFAHAEGRLPPPAVTP
jgi:hypothetical protein